MAGFERARSEGYARRDVLGLVIGPDHNDDARSAAVPPLWGCATFIQALILLGPSDAAYSLRHANERGDTPLKVLVTGAAGFIGSHAAHTLAARGDEVVGLDNLSRPGARINLDWLQGDGSLTDFAEIDIRDQGAMDAFFQRHHDADLVLHAAGQVAVTSSVADPRSDFEINALGTLNVLEAMRAHAPGAALFYTSSNKVYGDLENLEVVAREGRYDFASHPDGVAEDQPLDFHSPYGCSKGAGDQYVRDYARIYGLRTVVFRQSCIYGTRQFGVEDQGWIAWFCIAGVLGLPVSIYGDGRQVRDVLWVDDLVALYVRAMERIDDVRGRVYNVGGGRFRLSLWDLVRLLEDELGHEIKPAMGAWRPGDQRVFVSDTRRARADLDWAPAVAPAEGIRQLVAWARENEGLLRQVVGSMGQ
jgi:CDP-paratose 2-epimerase